MVTERRSKLFFKIGYRLMLVKSIAECSKGSILQYFRPSLSYHLPLRSLFCLFLSGRLRQVLLYVTLCAMVVGDLQASKYDQNTPLSQVVTAFPGQINLFCSSFGDVSVMVVFRSHVYSKSYYWCLLLVTVYF